MASVRPRIGRDIGRRSRPASASRPVGSTNAETRGREAHAAAPAPRLARQLRRQTRPVERAATAVEKAIARDALELVRFSFPDQHGVLRGKTLLAAEAVGAMRGGVTMTSTVLA